MVGEKLAIPVDIDANDPRAVAVQKCGIVGTALFSSIFLCSNFCKLS